MNRPTAASTVMPCRATTACLVPRGETARLAIALADWGLSLVPLPDVPDRQFQGQGARSQRAAMRARFSHW